MMNNVQGQAGYTRLLSAGGTPRASSVNNRTEPESIVARLTPSTGRVTKSAPALKISSKDDSEPPFDEDFVGRKLFTQPKERHEVSYYINYDTIHCSQTEGRKSRFQLPECPVGICIVQTSIVLDT